MMRIRPAAVIFDYGNVLSSPQGSSEVERMASLFNVSVDRFREAYWKFRLSYDEAALDPAAYWRSVAQYLSRTLSQSQIAGLVEIDARSWAHPARLVVEWARDIHSAGLKTGLLSNMPTPVREYVERCEWLPPFDQRTFSCDVHRQAGAGDFLALPSGTGGRSRRDFVPG